MNEDFNKNYGLSMYAIEVGTEMGASPEAFRRMERVEELCNKSNGRLQSRQAIAMIIEQEERERNEES